MQPGTEAWPEAPARKRVLAAIVLLGAVLPRVTTAGADVATIAVEDDTYSYHFSATFDAPREVLHAIVTDFDRQHRFNDSVTASRVLERYDDGHLKRLLQIDQCILHFCFTLDYVEDVVVTDDVIRTTIIPEESNFLGGVVTWKFEALSAERSRIVVSGRQTPDFWIPPVIGAWVLERVFREEANETCDKLASLARAASP